MDEALTKYPMTDQRISEAVEREQSRLRNFIRRHVADPSDAEDILQDVFSELAEAYRLMSRTMAENAMTCDAQEGMSAFLEKRQPTWRGE